MIGQDLQQLDRAVVAFDIGQYQRKCPVRIIGRTTDVVGDDIGVAVEIFRRGGTEKSWPSSSKLMRKCPGCAIVLVQRRVIAEPADNVVSFARPVSKSWPQGRPNGVFS